MTGPPKEPLHSLKTDELEVLSMILGVGIKCVLDISYNIPQRAHYNFCFSVYILLVKMKKEKQMSFMTTML